MSLSTVEVSSTRLAHDHQPVHHRQVARELRSSFLVKGDSISQQAAIKAGQVLSRLDVFRYQLYTIWLFTENDITTFLVQCFLFGIFGAASGRLTTTVGARPFGFFDAVANLPRLVLFNWLNLLIFNLGNQSMPGAPEEDALNKPQRPIPAGRITQREAQNLLMGLILVTLPVMFALDVHLETSLLIVFEYMYNELGGGDVHYHVRNALLGIGFALYNAGSLKLAVGPLGRVNGAGYMWIAVVSAVILSTMHIQDFKDQAGDAKRGRRTMPLVLGDATARGFMAATVAFWALFCPVFWHCGVAGFGASVVTGAVVVSRLFLCRTQKADAWTWKLWSLFLAVVYIMPSLSSV